MQLAKNFNITERSSELGWTYPVCGLSDASPIWHEDAPLQFKVVYDDNAKVHASVMFAN